VVIYSRKLHLAICFMFEIIFKLLEPLVYASCKCYHIRYAVALGMVSCYKVCFSKRMTLGAPEL